MAINSLFVNVIFTTQCVVTLAGNRDQGENGGGGLANKVFS